MNPRTDGWIQSLVLNHNLISNFLSYSDQSQVIPAGVAPTYYTMRLAHWRAPIDKSFIVLSEQPSLDHIWGQLHDEPIVLSAGEMIRVTTIEELNVTGRIVALVTLSKHWSDVGLVMAPFWLMPNTNGPVEAVVHNHGKFQVLLGRDDGIFDLAFFVLNEQPTKEF